MVAKIWKPGYGSQNLVARIRKPKTESHDLVAIYNKKNYINIFTHMYINEFFQSATPKVVDANNGGAQRKTMQRKNITEEPKRKTERYGRQRETTGDNVRPHRPRTDFVARS